MTNRTLMAWFAVGHFANDWPIAALWLIVPAAGLSMHLSPAEVGLLFTLSTIGGALVYVPAGLVADHVSNRGCLLVSTFFWVAIGYAIASLASGFWSLAVLLAIAGMGNAAWHPIATGVLTSANRNTRARALGIHAVGGSLAEVLAPLSAGLVLSTVDWRGALVVSVLPTVFVGLCFLRVAEAVPAVKNPRVNRQDISELMQTWRSRSGLRLVATVSLYNMVLIGLLSMIPFYLATAHGFASGTIGIAFAAIVLSGSLAQPWVGSISDRIGRLPVLATGNGFAAFAIGTLMFDPPFWIMIALMTLGVASLDAVRPVILAAAVDHSDRSEGTTLGFAFAILDGVGAFGAVLAGVAAGFSWGVMFGLGAALAVTVTLLSVGACVGQSDTAIPLWCPDKRKTLDDRRSQS